MTAKITFEAETDRFFAVNQLSLLISFGNPFDLRLRVDRGEPTEATDAEVSARFSDTDDNGSSGRDVEVLE